MNTIGQWFRISVFGESHGAAVGVLVDGVPAGVPFSEKDVQPELDRRRPGQSLLTTQRAEGDRVTIATGVLDGFTTGAPVLMTVANADTRSQDYRELLRKPRPGHSDYPARVRFGGFNDPRGGGMFSGRLTAAHVMAGALARRILEPTGLQVAAHTVRVGTETAPSGFSVDEIRAHVEDSPVRCAFPPAAAAMEAAVLDARNSGDSVGGVIECVAEGVPAGWGEPTAWSLESALAAALFAVPAVKGVEFGDGFAIAGLRGSAARDDYTFDDAGDVRTTANHNGGILGGLTTGMPVRCRVAFKPTSSIPLTQRTVDLESRSEADLKVRGRHDPCIVPRAVPVVEAVMLSALADVALAGRALKPDRTKPWPGGDPV